MTDPAPTNQLAADVRERPINHNKGFLYGIRPAELAALMAHITDLEAQVRLMEQSATEDNAAYQTRIEVSREYLARAEAAEAQVAALRAEADAAWALDRHGHQFSDPRWSIRDIEKWLLALGADEELRAAMAGACRAEAAEAALAEMEQRWLGMRDCYDREVIRGGKAERALATTRQALTEIADGCARWEAWDKTAEDQEHWRKAAIARVSVIGAAARRALAATGTEQEPATAVYREDDQSDEDEAWEAVS